jgi:hypothetical protein
LITASSLALGWVASIKTNRLAAATKSALHWVKQEIADKQPDAMATKRGSRGRNAAAQGRRAGRSGRSGSAD